MIFSISETAQKIFKLNFFVHNIKLVRFNILDYSVVNTNMVKVATDFMKRHNWTSETPSSELAKYTEEINKSLKDDRKVRFNAKTRFQQLGLTKEQVEVLIPI